MLRLLQSVTMVVTIALMSTWAQASCCNLGCCDCSCVANKPPLPEESKKAQIVYDELQAVLTKHGISGRLEEFSYSTKPVLHGKVSARPVKGQVAGEKVPAPESCKPTCWKCGTALCCGVTCN